MVSLERNHQIVVNTFHSLTYPRFSALPPGFSHEVPQHLSAASPYAAPIDELTGLPYLDFENYCCGAHGLSVWLVGPADCQWQTSCAFSVTAHLLETLCPSTGTRPSCPGRGRGYCQGQTHSGGSGWVSYGTLKCVACRLTAVSLRRWTANASTCSWMPVPRV